ncbi:MAG: NADH-quinone oxidoreductase subunit N [Verrucomicrobia bacterium]|nr:NADH-quinone oxidoreductase subunit N [Verrucomicrobiota bacterium]
MNSSLLAVEFLVVVLGLGVLLADLWIPATARRGLAYVAATGLLLILTLHGGALAPGDHTAFGGMFLVDALSNFFKGLFLVTGILILLMAAGVSDRLDGFGEYVALTLFALTGMLLAASANDFILMFVSLELVTVTFYILVSFHRRRQGSLEAGVKYLIFGALAAAFMVYGIALIFGAANTTNFYEIAARQAELGKSPVFLIGLLLTLVGLGFKISAFPFQMWTPDVYQGAPTPTTAFLASGSKAAGFVLLVRLSYSVVPEIMARWGHLLLGFAIITMLYGSFCALAQRSVKRLMGYSSIANAGYLLLGIAAANFTGSSAILYFLAGYLLTTLAAFAVIARVTAADDHDDISVFAGLCRRSPALAAAMTLALVSLAGVPPLAGFFGKFYLFRSAALQVPSSPLFLVAILAACVSVVMSLYYYFNIIRVMYWPAQDAVDRPVHIPLPAAIGLAVALAGIIGIGLFPGGVIGMAQQAVAGLGTPPPEMHAGGHHAAAAVQ